MSTPAANDVVSFKDRATADQAKPHNYLLVIELTIQDIDVAKVLVDTGCSANIIYKSTVERMEIDLCAVTERPSPIFRLSGNATMTLSSIDLVVKDGSVIKVTEFLVIDRPTSYNAIVGTPWLNSMRAIPSTFHMCLRFPTPHGVETIQGDRRMSQSQTSIGEHLLSWIDSEACKVRLGSQSTYSLRLLAKHSLKERSEVNERANPAQKALAGELNQHAGQLAGEAQPSRRSAHRRAEPTCGYTHPTSSTITPVSSPAS
ncbi:hypothetical protein F2Q68_00031925 [Brassica cretica]|uniref:Uncharacterized protein n=1 Tax=Brassica cretica TaxID=69181 RepID=A0A8S9GH84_BRACR|nr:hypothetical protein F2Q68_00031925 [Brassica cretica]